MSESTERASNHKKESKRRAREVLKKHADRLLDTYHDVSAIDFGYKMKDGIERREWEVCMLYSVGEEEAAWGSSWTGPAPPKRNRWSRCRCAWRRGGFDLFEFLFDANGETQLANHFTVIIFCKQWFNENNNNIARCHIKSKKNNNHLCRLSPCKKNNYPV